MPCQGFLFFVTLLLGCHLAALWNLTQCWLLSSAATCHLCLNFNNVKCTECAMPSRLWCPKWAKTNACSWDYCWTQGYYVGSVLRPAWLWLAVTPMMGILIHYLPVFAMALCLNLAADIFIFKVHLLELCFQVLFSMVQACKDIIISGNTDSAPIALLFGISQSCKQETGVSWALLLGSPRCLQLNHLSAQLRRFLLLSTVVRAQADRDCPDREFRDTKLLYMLSYITQQEAFCRNGLKFFLKKRHSECFNAAISWYTSKLPSLWNDSAAELLVILVPFWGGLTQFVWHSIISSKQKCSFMVWQSILTRTVNVLE